MLIMAEAQVVNLLNRRRCGHEIDRDISVSSGLLHLHICTACRVAERARKAQSASVQLYAEPPNVENVALVPKTRFNVSTI
jgi:hypothetical protein